MNLSSYLASGSFTFSFATNLVNYAGRVPGGPFFILCIRFHRNSDSNIRKIQRVKLFNNTPAL